jgi:signal transduction histidine kinase
MNLSSVSRIEPVTEPRSSAGVGDHFCPALLGELAGPLGHEFNNFLNNILLELAILDSRVPESARPRLATLRKYASRLTELVRRFQDFPLPRATEVRPVALNSIVRDVALAWEQACESKRLHLELAEDLPLVQAPAADLQRLLFLIFKDATGRMANGTSILVRSRHTGTAVQLSLENAGQPDPASEEHGLELAACKLIVGRLDGSLHFQPSPDGGITLLVELPLATSTSPGA